MQLICIFFFMRVGLYLICFLCLLLMQCLKKKKKDIAGQGVAFLDCFLIGPQIGPKSNLARWGSWGPRSPVGWVWALGKKPV